MMLNADFSKPVLVREVDNPWTPSPMAGVARKMLDRVGDEVARATSIVRYAPGSHFSEHTHGGGEEFIVLEGVFQDEHGDYPVGSYVRNPPTSSHVPRSEIGCTIFVKLWQFDPDDREFVRIDMASVQLVSQPEEDHVRSAVLYSDAQERVQLYHLAPHSEMTLSTEGGLETLVLKGELIFDDHTLRPCDWIRLPDGYKASFRIGPSGAEIWTKTGHLAHIRFP